MFIPSKLHHSSSKLKSNSKLADTFGILCWNVHKNNNKQKRFKKYLETIERHFDFMLFQEANFRDNDDFVLPHFTYDAAANLQLRDHFYGVLTASRIESTTARAFLSQGKESLVGPHKSLLFSSYDFKDNQTLLILNVHAINFRENQRFNKEIDRFRELLEAQKGPMIVAGDFNTWNKKRLEKLHTLREKLGLKMVEFSKERHIKSFMGNHLDFIFYRDLELIKSSNDNTHGLSDHNPLFAQFKKI